MRMGKGAGLINFAVPGSVLGADAVAGGLRVGRRLVEIGAFNQIVNVAVVGAVVQNGVPQLRGGITLQ